MFFFKYLVITAFTAATAKAAPLESSTVAQVLNDLNVIANRIQQISTSSIFAATAASTVPGPAPVTPPVFILTLAVVNTINATDIAAKTAAINCANATAFTEAQCTRLLDATEALVYGTLQFALQDLVATHDALAMTKYWIYAFQALELVRTDLHTFVGNLGAKCPSAAGKTRAVSIQTIVDTTIQSTLNTI